MMDDYIQESINVGRNLKYLRNKRGLSLEKLSKKLNIPRGTLGYLECGYSKPSVERQEILASFYDLDTTDDLFADQSEFLKKYGA